MQNTNNLIPVTILTGFLGAGKTSLLNNIIKDNQGKKLVVLENEFGEINIDSDLVIKGSNELFELSNGCICCTVSGDFIETLDKIVREVPFASHLIVECTGMADPSAVAAAFLSDPMVQASFKLKSTVCLVDAVHFESQQKSQQEVKKQIAFSDVILINKKDLVNSQQINTIKDIVSKINPFVPCVETEQGVQNEINLLEYDAYDSKLTENQIRFYPIVPSVKHSEVSAESFVFDHPIDLLKFRHWIHAFLVIQGDSIYRIKGVLNFGGLDERHIIQSVMGMATYSLGSDWEEGMVRTSKIVFIGKNLRRDLIEKGLKGCFSDYSFI